MAQKLGISARKAKGTSAVNAMWKSASAGLEIIWGFVSSDFLTFAVPNTIFGVIGALPGTGLTQIIIGNQLHSDTQRRTVDVLYRVPKVLLFNFYSLFLFDLSNQHWPESVREDSVNKPWRPIPSGQITPRQTRRLLMILAPAALGTNYLLGVWSQGLLVQVLSWYYNDLRGCDEIFRDAIIAVSYGLANLTSLRLASSSSYFLSATAKQANLDGAFSLVDGATSVTVTPRGYLWVAMISGVILTTMHIQDLKDQKGDQSRNRKTVPLVLGDWVSRWTVAGFVPFWSVVCAAFWHQQTERLPEGFLGYIAQLVLGLIVAWRVLSKQSRRDDAGTWRLWCVWHSSLYLLPLVGRIVSGPWS
ncbi:Digeranylgeranylglyceryl phosphate synthase [Rhypophila sp. PSN 637]